MIDVPLPSPSYYYYYYFNDAGQLFYRRIDSSHVMADTLGDEQKFSLAEASKHLYNDERSHLCLVNKYLTPFTCTLEKYFLDTVFTLIDQNNHALVSFFFLGR